MKIQLSAYGPAKTSDVSDLESRLGASLPLDYRDFLMEFDGAKVKDNVFGDDLNISVERFIPVNECAVRCEKVDGFPEKAFPIAEASSGNFVYMKTDGPGVFFWDHEIDRDKKLADTFAGFLNQLRPFDINDVQLKPEQVKSVWVDPDFKPEF